VQKKVFVSNRLRRKSLEVIYLPQAQNE